MLRSHARNMHRTRQRTRNIIEVFAPRGITHTWKYCGSGLKRSKITHIARKIGSGVQENEQETAHEIRADKDVRKFCMPSDRRGACEREH